MGVDIKLKPEDPSVSLTPESSEASAIVASGLGCRYGKRWVVRDLDLEVPQGSVTALLGRNGVGKSTTIQMLLGLLRPSQGSVRVLGLEPQSQRHRVFRELAYVSERRELLEDTRVSELAKIVAEIHGERFDRDGFERLRARYELAPQAKCKTLSKGQRARLLLALSLMARPRVLVLDEPTSGLDVLVRDDFLEAIAHFASEEGHAVLLSTHLIDDVSRICDRAIVLRQGAPAITGDLDDLRRSCNRYVVHLDGVVPYESALDLPEGVVVTERDPRAITLVARGQSEHLEHQLDQILPLRDLERHPANMKEAFACLTAPGKPGGAA